MKALWRKKLGRPSYRSSSASSRQLWLPSELPRAWATAHSQSEQKLVNLSASAISHTRGCGFLFFIKRDFVTFDFVTLRASQLWMSSKLSDSQQYIAWYRNLCRDQNTRLLFCYLHFILGISLCLTRKCLWTHSISSHTQKTCLYSAESSKNFKIPQSIDHNLAFITPAMNSQECLFISSRSHKIH